MSNKDPLKGYITQKGLPHYVESERAVLSILINNNAMQEMLIEHGIGVEHFHSPILQDVYLTCGQVLDSGQNIDALVVLNILRKKYPEGNIREIVVELVEASYLTNALKTHINNLIEYKERRDIVIEACGQVKRAYSDDGEFSLKIDPFFEDFTARSLMKIDFPNPKWIVPKIIPEGLTILSGRPKIGKSIISLNLAVAVAMGGKALGNISVERSGVLYLALEDTLKRLKNRFWTILQGQNPPENLYLNTEFKTIRDGGLEQLKVWLKQHKDVGFVILDTLAKIKGRAEKNSELYMDDYGVIAKIKEVADKHDIGILLVHHTRKAQSDDIFDMVLGTTGITGAADTVIVLKKEMGVADIALHVCGRDVEEAELALKFDAITMGYVLLGNAKEYRMSRERQEIMDVIREDGKPIRLKEIATVLGKRPDAIAHLLRKLVKDDLLKQPNYGMYAIDDNKNIQ